MIMITLKHKRMWQTLMISYFLCVLLNSFPYYKEFFGNILPWTLISSVKSTSTKLSLWINPISKKHHIRFKTTPWSLKLFNIMHQLNSSLINVTTSFWAFLVFVAQINANVFYLWYPKNSWWWFVTWNNKSGQETVSVLTCHIHG